MTAYIIEYRPADGQSHISQEGYATLAAAQTYIERRPGNPRSVTPMRYEADGGEYLVHDIRIVGGNQNDNQ